MSIRPSRAKKIICGIIGHGKCRAGERCPRCGYIKFAWYDGIVWFVLEHPYVKGLRLVPKGEQRARTD